VASAFGLQHLLRALGKDSHIIYEGEIQRDSLLTMIAELSIDIHLTRDHELTKDSKIIIVDGCKGNRNVTDLLGDKIAIIDHHQSKSPDDVLFSDIRSEQGACSTIIYGYYTQLNIPVPRMVATALMIGINMDTSLLTRGVSKEDIRAYADLYPLSDIRLHNAILRNYIQTKDLSFYRYAIDHVEIDDRAAFCFFPDGCNQNLMGILGDFFLSLQEVEFVALCAKNPTSINFSLRSERNDWNASVIIQDLLQGVGFGGGHRDMAGGITQDPALFDYQAFKLKCRSLLDLEGEVSITEEVV
jgi:nanoRNase/pAp phosphatase (c-di-AMP/oligoRNAs hydrolase)